MSPITKKLFLIPSRKQFTSWSMPSKVTYVAGWLAILSLVWGFFVFFHDSGTKDNDSESIRQSTKGNQSPTVISNDLKIIYEETWDLNSEKEVNKNSKK